MPDPATPPPPVDLDAARANIARLAARQRALAAGLPDPAPAEPSSGAPIPAGPATDALAVALAAAQAARERLGMAYFWLSMFLWITIVGYFWGSVAALDPHADDPAASRFLTAGALFLLWLFFRYLHLAFSAVLLPRSRS